MPMNAPETPAPDPPRRTAHAIGALVLALSAPCLWWATIDSPALRASGAAAWIALAISIVLAARRPGSIGACGSGPWRLSK